MKPLISRVPNRGWAAFIGIGIAISPVHNQALTNLATTSGGEVLVFLPALGYLCIIMGTFLFLLWRWEQVGAAGLGDKRVYIPIFVIAIAIAISGIAIDGGLGDKVAPMGVAVTLVALYLVARVLGGDLFIPLAVGAAVGSAGILIYQLIYFGGTTGGYLFGDNYDIATGYILLGTALLIRHRQLQRGLAVLALVALFLSGSAEAIFAIAVMGVVFVIRGEWRKHCTLFIPLLVVMLAVLATDWGRDLHSITIGGVLGDTSIVCRTTDLGVEQTVVANRWWLITDAMRNLRPLGEGYILTEFQRVNMVHNVPIVIVQQLGYAGILAALAWWWVTLYCTIKTRWKYAWMLVLALSVFDHYIWTQLAPVWPAMVGALTMPQPQVEH